MEKGWSVSISPYNTRLVFSRRGLNRSQPFTSELCLQKFPGCCCSVTKSCPTHCDMAYGMPGLRHGAQFVVAKGLWGSMKLRAMPCRATQDGWVTGESSDKTRSTGGGDGKPLQYPCPKKPIHSIKRQKEVSTEVWNWGSKRNKTIQCS